MKIFKSLILVAVILVGSFFNIAQSILIAEHLGVDLDPLYAYLETEEQVEDNTSGCGMSAQLEHTWNEVELNLFDEDRFGGGNYWNTQYYYARDELSPCGRPLHFAMSVLTDYLENTEYRVSYCEQYGVDISYFSTLYYQQNKEIIYKAFSILENADVSIDEINEKHSEVMAESIHHSMEYLRKELGPVTNKATCEKLSSNQEDFAKYLALENQAPWLVAHIMALPDKMYKK